ncbi:MAG TPA: CbiX/SirB N-terminal domain-containing protein [Ktedonobacterales bacterium]|jgi:sirohydrochlorin ferrochelatase|nr:CbiX/SirB N-terminal domain-containing protein [Ktedonobacterales bacterium]
MRASVILLGHGSHRSRATDLGLREVHRRLAERLRADADVALAFFEFLHPTLAETVAELAAAGVRRALLMPYFLFEGREIQRDIPGELAHLRERFPTLAITMAATLGIHPQLIALAAERVRQALDGVGQLLPTAGRFPRRGETGRVGVVLVNRGVRRQYDDGGRLAELCRLLSGALGGDTLVAPALAENSPDTVEVAADHLVVRGARRVVVMPYLNFPGKVLAESVVAATNRARLAHPEVKHYLASTLCVDDRIVEVCVERIRAGLGAPSMAGIE